MPNDLDATHEKSGLLHEVGREVIGLARRAAGAVARRLGGGHHSGDESGQGRSEPTEARSEASDAPRARAARTSQGPRTTRAEAAPEAGQMQSAPPEEALPLEERLARRGVEVFDHEHDHGYVPRAAGPARNDR